MKPSKKEAEFQADKWKTDARETWIVQTLDERSRCWRMIFASPSEIAARNYMAYLLTTTESRGVRLVTLREEHTRV